jgi:hypothetical protein
LAKPGGAISSRTLLSAIAGALLVSLLAAATGAWATPGQKPRNQVIATPAALDRLSSLPSPSPETAAAEPVSQATPYRSPHERFGFCRVRGSLTNYAVEQLHAGWYVDFTSRPAPPRPAGVEYAQTVRVKAAMYNSAAITATLGPVADANPGSLWLIGNEPDRRGDQDDRMPAEYAAIYHDLYTFLKGRDPTCRVAIGGVVQPTPLRLKYLDMVLEAYRNRYGGMMPVDVWNVHGFILREDWTWGAGLPPGTDAYQDLGMLYEVQDNDNIEIFRRQIRAFRQWMADHGERDKPLIVSEYGVLMPPDYGFDQERVRQFMAATFDFFLTTTDDRTGYPADGNRLVQRWSWYSLDDRVYTPETGIGFNGNLFDADTREITPLGRAYGAYTAPDLTITGITFDVPRAASPGEPVTVTITANVADHGLSPARGVLVRFWNGDPAQGGARLDPDQTIEGVMPGASQQVQMIWTGVSSGVHTVTAEVDPDDSIREANEANNTVQATLRVPSDRIFLPFVR